PSSGKNQLGHFGGMLADRGPDQRPLGKRRSAVPWIRGTPHILPLREWVGPEIRSASRPVPRRTGPLKDEAHCLIASGDRNPSRRIRRNSMLGKTLVTPLPRESPHGDRPAAAAGRSVRFSILSWAEAGFLLAVVGALVVLTSDPTPQQEVAPPLSL